MYKLIDDVMFIGGVPILREVFLCTDLFFTFLCVNRFVNCQPATLSKYVLMQKV